MGLNVSIDRDACMGSGQCVFAAPGVFDLDDSAIAEVVDVSAASDDTVIEVARSCPTRAISVWRDGEQLV